MLRDPLASPVEVGEEGEKAEVEVEREEADEMTLTGTVACRRLVLGGARERDLCSR